MIKLTIHLLLTVQITGPRFVAVGIVKDSPVMSYLFNPQGSLVYTSELSTVVVDEHPTAK